MAILKNQADFTHRILFTFLPVLFFTILLLAGGTLTLNAGNRIYWQTASQTNLAGFNLYRAEKKDGPIELLNQVMIPVKGDRLSGFRYEFLDGDVSSGKVYYYWIDVLRLDGSSERLPEIEIKTTLYGPIFLALGCFSGMCFLLIKIFYRRHSKHFEDGGV